MVTVVVVVTVVMVVVAAVVAAVGAGMHTRFAAGAPSATRSSWRAVGPWRWAAGGGGQSNGG